MLAEQEMEFITRVLIAVVTLLVLERLSASCINRTKSWQDSIAAWAPKIGLHLRSTNFASFPAYSGSYEEHDCEVSLRPVGFGTELRSLYTRIEVRMNCQSAHIIAADALVDKGQQVTSKHWLGGGRISADTMTSWSAGY